MFEVTADPRRRHLHIVLHGYWDLATMSRYEAAVRHDLSALNRLGGCRTVLIDMTDFPIQRKEVADRHEALLDAAGKNEAMRVALVMQREHSKLQSKRVVASTGHKPFATEEDALAWLLEARRMSSPDS